MRITKAVIRESKTNMRSRICELCALMATGGLKQEWENRYRPMTTTGKDHELLQSLLLDMTDEMLPPDLLY